MTKEDFELLRSEFNKRLDELEKSIKKDEWLEGKKYFFANSVGEIISSIYSNDEYDLYRLHYGRLWKKEADCRRYNEIDKKYKKLVYELNLKDPIDWNNNTQIKYFIIFDYQVESTFLTWNHTAKSQNIYCTDKDLLQKSVDLIGQNDLDWYMENYRA